MKVTFNLIRKAKSMGGDRYEAEVAGKQWTVYFPQEISRKGGEPVETLVINIDVN